MNFYDPAVTDAPPSTPTPTTHPSSRGIVERHYLLTTAGMFALVFFSAFEALAVTTVMPGVARELDGVRWFALSFAAPLASGVVGMVAAGRWSDRSGPAAPLLTAIAAFGAGLLVCGLAPSMPALVAGRLLQGLGGGALTVGLYVVVGQVYPRTLQPSVFASFAAAWVLPSLVGPSIAAWVAATAGWRWVFLGVVVLVAGATALIGPSLRSLPPRAAQPPATGSSRMLGWAMVAAAAVLTLDLADEALRHGWVLSALGALVAAYAVRALVPPGTLTGRAGLPSVVATRGTLSAAFFSAEAFLPFVLQDRWGWSPAAAGAVLAAAGLSWAAASQLQARLRDRLTDPAAMQTGAAALAAGTALAWVTVAAHASPVLLVVAYAVAAAGMGTGYPRTSVATLAVSDDADRGFNSSALSVADSLGGALALAVSGIVFAHSDRSFPAVFVLPVAWSLVAVAAARRTRA